MWESTLDRKSESLQLYGEIDGYLGFTLLLVFSQ